MSSAGFIIAIAIIAGNCWLMWRMWSAARAARGGEPSKGTDGGGFAQRESIARAHGERL